MTFQARVVCDSIQPDGIRLATMELVYPLKIHNEFLTHRAIGRSDSAQYDEWLEFSRNAASNRALTSEQIIWQILADTFIPRFRSATRGMIAGDLLPPDRQEQAAAIWVRMRDEMIAGVRELQDLGVHKSERNRALGPFQWITVVATANGEMWEHFFRLRDHRAAEQDMQVIAAMAHALYERSTPKELDYGEWHLPYIAWEDYAVGGATVEERIKISVARCARTSFLHQGDMRPLRDDLTLYSSLVERTPENDDPVHASPAEHQARATFPHVRSGNFIGYEQYRKVLRL